VRIFRGPGIGWFWEVSEEEAAVLLDAITDKMGLTDTTDAVKSMLADMEIKILNEMPTLRQEDFVLEFFTEDDDKEPARFVRSRPVGDKAPKWHKVDLDYSHEGVRTGPGCRLLIMPFWDHSTDEPPTDELHCLRCFPDAGRMTLRVLLHSSERTVSWRTGRTRELSLPVRMRRKLR
jgi:hypothetical protein